MRVLPGSAAALFGLGALGTSARSTAMLVLLVLRLVLLCEGSGLCGSASGISS